MESLCARIGKVSCNCGMNATMKRYECDGEATRGRQWRECGGEGGCLAPFLPRKQEQALQLWLDFYLRLYNRRYAINNAALIADFLPRRHRHHRIRCHVIVRPRTSCRNGVKAQ